MNKIVFKRGTTLGTLIVENKGVYYLVSMDTMMATKADPPNRPDMFLKFGYFESVELVEITEEVQNRVDVIMKKSNF